MRLDALCVPEIGEQAGAPKGGDVWVGDHDGLQVEAAISHKHN